jgi:hypothetical protein
MQTTIQNDEVILRIPKKFYTKDIQRLVANIEFKKVVSKSKATTKDVEKLLLQIKAERGKVVKPLLDRVKAKL